MRETLSSPPVTRSRTWPALLALAVAIASGAHAQPPRATTVSRDALLARAEAYGRRFCPSAAPGSELDGVRVEALERVAPDEAIALVRTACHAEADGAYNHTSSVVHLAPSGDAPVVFGARPDWVRDDLAEDANLVYGASLARRGADLFLESASLERGLGDVGWSMTFRWSGDRFAPFVERLRGGGSLAPAATGPFPIIGPPERECRASLELAPDGRAVLRAYAHGRQRATTFELDAEGCELFGPEAIQCGRRQLDAEVEYQIIARGGEWTVVRLGADDTQRVVVSRRRGCAL